MDDNSICKYYNTVPNNSSADGDRSYLFEVVGELQLASYGLEKSPECNCLNWTLLLFTQ